MLRVQFLNHQATMEMAGASLTVVASLLRDEEHKAEVFAQLYEAAKAVIEDHEERVQRMIRRIKGS